MLALLRPMRRDDGDFDRFAGYADAMLEEKEFFIRKAIGWVLRGPAKAPPRPRRRLARPARAPRLGRHRPRGRQAAAGRRARGLLAGYRDKRPVRCEHEGSDLAG